MFFDFDTLNAIGAALVWSGIFSAVAAAYYSM